MQIFPRLLEKIMEDGELKKRDIQVFLYILLNAGKNNAFFKTQEKIAEEMKVTRPTASAAVQVLVERGYLIRCQKMGSTYTYKIPCELFWNGTEAMLKREQKKTIRQIQASTSLDY